MKVDGTYVSWDLDICRDLYDWELEEVGNLMELLNAWRRGQRERDCKVWVPDPKGQFSVKSLYSVLLDDRSMDFPCSKIWEAPVPQRVIFFMWEASLHKVNTVDRLQRCGAITVNRCYMCKSGLETIHHLLFTCNAANQIWAFFLQQFTVSWTFPKTVMECFTSWSCPVKTPRGKLIWEIQFFAITWGIWKERNRRVFRDKEETIEEIILDIKAIVFRWASTNTLFRNSRQHTAFEVASGTSVKFWHDTWVGEVPLKVKFPVIFRLSRKQDAWVSEVMKVDGTYVSWDLDICRDLYDWELEEVGNLMELLNAWRRGQRERDCKVWVPDPKGQFSVKSLYSVLLDDRSMDFPCSKIWEAPVPQRVIFFMWEASLHKVNTVDRLQRCGAITVNRCYMCKSGLETIHHLLFTCNAANQIWAFFLQQFTVSWTFPKTVMECFTSWSCPVKTPRGKLIWEIQFFAITWGIWKERNRRVFRDKEETIEEIILDIKAMVFRWASTNTLFRNSRFQDFVFFWDSLLR
ncbi:Reverse transcriptase zinc-binding domain [Macleaya cordata]|uniref:Reverse transcriptase zinc-binding domain n=1 Tax=Macleaya cordata TaxID=56857 RepID=A0A200Q569_MACCD|nr:Reverse transcriptase zinc-binding domain [Macleaya cordata]